MYQRCFILMTSCSRIETETVSRIEKAAWTVQLLLQPSVSGVAVSAFVSHGHFELSKRCGVLAVQCVNLMLRICEFGVLLFDSLVYCQNVTCLKRLAGMGITQVR